MAETQTSKTVEWYPGQYWQPGQPIPEDAMVVPHQGGLATLERKAPEGFDKDIRQKVLRHVDMAWERSIKEPSPEYPEGMRPWRMLVNREFRKLFRYVRVWGDLEPPVEVELVGDDRVFNNKPNAVRVPYKGGYVCALFVTTKGDEESF